MKCKHCGMKFNGRADAKYCSDYCRGKAFRKAEHRAIQIKGREIEVTVVKMSRQKLPRQKHNARNKNPWSR